MSASSIFKVLMFVGSLEFCQQTDKQSDYSNPPLRLRGRGLKMKEQVEMYIIISKLKALHVLYCVHDLLPSTLSDTIQHNVRIGSDSIFASAELCFTNQFSEFYVEVVNFILLFRYHHLYLVYIHFLFSYNIHP